MSHPISPTGCLDAIGMGTFGARAGALERVLLSACGVGVCEAYTMCLSGEPDKRYRPCATLDSPCGKVP